MKLPGEKTREPLRSAAGMGLAFLCGALVFLATFFIVRHFRGGAEREALLPANQRPSGAVDMPVFRHADGTDPTPGETFSLDALHGRVVVVNYFATWCPPCLAEMPDLLKLAKEYEARGVTIVAVSIDRNDDFPGQPRDPIIRAFAQQHAMTIPLLQPTTASAIWKTPIPVPQTYVYDKTGRRAGSILGQLDEPTLRAWLDQLLLEK